MAGGFQAIADGCHSANANGMGMDETRKESVAGAGHIDGLGFNGWEMTVFLLRAEGHAIFTYGEIDLFYATCH